MSIKLFRRGDIWYLRGTVRGARVYESAGTADRDLAEAYRARREAQIWDRRVFGQRAARTFAEASLIYLEGHRFGPSYRATVRKIVIHFGPMLLAEIDQATLDSYIHGKHPGAAAGTVIRAVITPVTAIMRSAAKRGWCDSPAFERPKVHAHRPRFLTEAEATRLIEAAAPHLRPLIVFLLYTGARLGEALRLTWDDVDLKARRTKFLRTKNGAPRGLPLAGPAWEALANLPHRAGTVFRTPAGRPYYDSGGRGGSPIKTAFAGACRRAGLAHVVGQTTRADGTVVDIVKPILRVHDLRHTFASWLVMRGVPLRTIAELMGHKTLDMVMRYAHLSPDHLRQAVETLPNGAKSVQRRRRHK